MGSAGPPPFTLFTITYIVRSTLEGRYASPISSPPLYVLCGPPFATGDVILRQQVVCSYDKCSTEMKLSLSIWHLIGVQFYLKIFANAQLFSTMVESFYYCPRISLHFSTERAFQKVDFSATFPVLFKDSLSVPTY